jgi:hypothetical protein
MAETKKQHKNEKTTQKKSPTVGEGNVGAMKFPKHQPWHKMSSIDDEHCRRKQ